MCFSERLKTLRKESNITQCALESRLFMSRKRIKMLELSIKMPNIVEIRGLAKYFHVRPAWLAWGEGAMNDESTNDG